MASIPQYMGFVYIDNTTTPSVIRVTEAGNKLIEYHNREIQPMEKLGDGRRRGILIEESKIYLSQFEKLQITNPIILRDCIDIYVFPLRLSLDLMRNLGYLDREEIGYYLFQTYDHSQIDVKLEEISVFREMNYEKRKRIIEAYKNSDFGNITLVQAPTTSYFEKLCEFTGIIERYEQQLPNPNSPLETIKALRIKDEYKNYVDYILDEKYLHADVYDFKDDVDLWVSYIGRPDRLYPPVDFSFINKYEYDVLCVIYEDENILHSDLIKANSKISFPLFYDEEYILKIISPEDGSYLFKENFKPSFDYTNLVINIDDDYQPPVLDYDELRKRIIELGESNSFDQKTLDYLKILEGIDGKKRTSNIQMKGGFYEYYFYKLLEILKTNGIVDEVVWNGRLGDYNLPRHAPGGKKGIPDMIFEINGIVFILEVTTIKARAKQFSAEGASVPDHIRNYVQRERVDNCLGIFCAPKIFQRNSASLRNTVREYGQEIISIKDKDILSIFDTFDRNKVIDLLLSCIKD
jgi:hypothetical protein